MKVYVYYNLHRHKWSVKALEGPQKGRVVQHLDSLWLTKAQPKVSQKGRERVLRDKVKNVHAGITGYIADSAPLSALLDDNDPREVTYNPYKYTGFVYKGDESSYNGSECVLMHHRKVYSY